MKTVKQLREELIKDCHGVDSMSLSYTQKNRMKEELKKSFTNQLIWWIEPITLAETIADYEIEVWASNQA